MTQSKMREKYVAPELLRRANQIIPHLLWIFFLRYILEAWLPWLYGKRRWLTKAQHPDSQMLPNSSPSGMTVGTSGDAPSAERDPDSLERDDDSLFPACLLELFLSHISSAKSPLLPFPWPRPGSHWLMTYPPPSSVPRSGLQSDSSKQTRCPCRQGAFNHFCD